MIIQELKGLHFYKTDRPGWETEEWSIMYKNSNGHSSWWDGLSMCDKTGSYSFLAGTKNDVRENVPSHFKKIPHEKVPENIAKWAVKALQWEPDIDNRG